MSKRRRARGWVLATACAALSAGCHPARFDATKATRRYPAELHQANNQDIQVFRDDTAIELVNATTRSYRDFDLWINQRYVRRVDALPAGGRLRLSLWEFWDVRGEGMNAGGLLRSDEPTPVLLVEIQAGDDEMLIGCVAIGVDND